jgi:ferrous iron transport protein A
MNEHGGQERQLSELGRLVKAGLTQPLSLMRRGGVGRILAVRSSDGDREVERGLLEMGFVEGACVEVLHYGFLGRDPLAVRINQSMTVALRRGEANAVLVGPLLDQSTDARSSASQEGRSS